MKIRSLQVTDLPAYFHLRTALWPDSAGRFELEVAGIIDAADQASFVAEHEQALIGFVEVSLRPYAEGCNSSPVGYLEGWYVAPQYRRSGVGRRLVETAEDWARAKGCLEMASDTELHNTQSQRAHQGVRVAHTRYASNLARLGYQEVVRLVCFRKSL